jgi:hypothetical protein
MSRIRRWAMLLFNANNIARLGLTKTNQQTATVFFFFISSHLCA